MINKWLDRGTMGYYGGTLFLDKPKYGLIEGLLQNHHQPSLEADKTRRIGDGHPNNGQDDDMVIGSISWFLIWNQSQFTRL